MSFNDLYSTSLNHQSVIIQTAPQKRIKYDESMMICSDWKFFIQTLIFENCSYRVIDIPIALYDTTGISSMNKELYKKERIAILNSLIPPRILQDYISINEDTDTLFYSLIKKSRFNRIVYTVLIFLFRIIAVFYRKANWVNRFPIFLQGR